MSQYDLISRQKYFAGTRIEGPQDVVVSGVATCFENKFVSLREVCIGVGNRKEYRSVLIMPDGLLAIPFRSDRRTILVRPLRPGSAAQHWEFPQERLEDFEPPEQGVIRCLKEEAGLIGDPESMEALPVLASFADRVTEKVHGFLVKGDFDLGARTDIQEIPEGCIGIFSFSEVLELISRGEMTCACNIAYALWAMRLLGL